MRLEMARASMFGFAAPTARPQSAAISRRLRDAGGHCFDQLGQCTPPMFPLVRSAALTGYATLARSLALEPERLVDAVGLPRAALEVPDLRVPVSRVATLLELSSSEAGVEDFGLRLAETRRISNLGLLGVIGSEAPSLRRGIEATGRYVRLHSEALSLQLERLETSWLVSPAVLIPQLDRIRQITELALAVTHRAFGELFGEDWRPEMVCIAHPAPRDPSSHRRIFGGRLQFGAVVTGFVCSEEMMDRRRPVPVSLLVHEARAHLEQLLAQSEPGTVARARETIAWLLPTGLCSAETVAERLGLDRRTLHRHLAREGESYATLVDEVRQDVARQQLSAGRRPLKEVAAALGFEAPSVLSRWFRARFGCSPTEWSERAATRAPEKAASTP
jgi:AraC-like DNA-binding protein